MRWPTKRFYSYFIAFVLLIYSVFFVGTPYYAFQPGSAEPLAPMVKSSGGYPEDGVFMLTTVRMRKANVFTYALSQFNTEMDIIKKSELLQSGETEKEYSERQDYKMMSSQSNAIQSAYDALSVPYTIQLNGIFILRTLAEMPAAKVLAAGDRLLSIDGRELKNTEQLLAYVGSKKVGDSVTFEYERNGKKRTDQLELGDLSQFETNDPEAKPRAGLGVVPVDLMSIEADAADQRVSIEAGSIGGPSAGLMFSLEIYNRLTPEDITKGYRIAGTGTIDPDGRKVGVIGGIKHKVEAAHKAGADIFFAPLDYKPKDPKYGSILNASEAKQKAAKLRTKMKIVPVATMDEALEYLSSLPLMP